MPVIGAYLRIEADTATAVCARLAAVAGITTFDLAQPGKLGIVIESPALEAAHALITQTIPAVPGVLGVWPIYVNNEDGATTSEDNERLTAPQPG